MDSLNLWFEPSTCDGKDEIGLKHNVCHGHESPLFLEIHPQWRFYIEASGGLSPQITKKEGFSPPCKFQGWDIILFAGLVTLTELTGGAVATYEAIASEKFVASVKIQLAGKK